MSGCRSGIRVGTVCLRTLRSEGSERTWPGCPGWVALQTRRRGLEGTGEVRLRDRVQESLRMRPSQITVGEVRDEEWLDLLLALNAGLPGMASPSAAGALFCRRVDVGSTGGGE
nr:ATPase, T2SS/T4P/T4SS family [Nocardioides mesophilus]